MQTTPTTTLPVHRPQIFSEQSLRHVADELEVTFLSEMLKNAGFGETPDTFGGGAGEDQFASLLREEQARQMVAAGGIGLSEVVFNALKEAHYE